MSNKIKVLFDTDIGTDIDDALALAYLLREERCELLGITTVTGEPVKRAKLASALCLAAGRPEIPVIPGIEKPLYGRVRQTPYTQEKVLERLDHQKEFADISAVEFMRKTIRENPGEVTLLAVGPLTNVALLFALDREIPTMLKSLVVMCGDFKSEKPEWNAKLDQFATAIVYSSELPAAVSYGFDVTSTFCIGHDEMVERFNGGIADTCQAYIPGSSGLVSYGTANTAAQINSDIEIVNVLSQHYDLSLPLFADNSERVNVLAHTDSQLISLAVSTDEDLKIETIKEAI